MYYNTPMMMTPAPIIQMPVMTTGYMPHVMPPVYIPPMPPQNPYVPNSYSNVSNGQPNVINVDKKQTGTPCKFCGTNTNQTVRKTVGCVTLTWSICLLFTTGFLCCIPCCMDSCKDSQIVCIKCHQKKTTIPANCC